MEMLRKILRIQSNWGAIYVVLAEIENPVNRLSADNAVLKKNGFFYFSLTNYIIRFFQSKYLKYFCNGKW